MDNMKQEQGICPVCGSEELSYDSMEIYGDYILYPWICECCGTHGEEIYRLKFIENRIKQNYFDNNIMSYESKKNEIVDFSGLDIIFVIISEILFILLFMLLSIE